MTSDEGWRPVVRMVLLPWLHDPYVEAPMRWAFFICVVVIIASTTLSVCMALLR